jgi:hypothetical protein
LGLFLRLAKQKRLRVDEAEANVKAELEGTLTHLGVIGATDEPRYTRFELRAFVGSSEPSATLQALWQEACTRAPLLNTLRRSAEVQQELLFF